MKRLLSTLREHQLTASAYLLCVVLFAVATIHTPGFASGSNVRQLLVFASFIGFAALGETIVVISGGLDLSVPWLMAFGGIQLSHWAGSGGLGGFGAIVAVVSVGAAIGLINGIGVAWVGIPPIVMTLAVGGLVQSYLLYLGLGQAAGAVVPHVARAMATATLGPLPVVAIVWIGAATFVGVFLSRTVIGRRLYAVGASDVVAHLSGVNNKRTRVLAYTVSGAASAFAGIVLVGYIGSTYLDIAAPYLFTAIAAVVVGGASILGGSGSYWGTVAGALTLTVLSAMLPLFSLTDADLKIVYGVAILAGVLLSTSGSTMFGWLRRASNRRRTFKFERENVSASHSKVPLPR